MALSCWETPVPMHASGVHHFWAFAPALDAQEVYAAAAEQCSDVLPTLSAAEDEEPLNVLLLTPSDPHSVLKTLSQRLRHGRRPLHVREPVIILHLSHVITGRACRYTCTIGRWRS